MRLETLQVERFASTRRLNNLVDATARPRCRHISPCLLIYATRCSARSLLCSQSCSLSFPADVHPRAAAYVIPICCRGSIDYPPLDDLPRPDEGSRLLLLLLLLPPPPLLLFLLLFPSFSRGLARVQTCEGWLENFVNFSKAQSSVAR